MLLCLILHVSNLIQFKSEFLLSLPKAIFTEASAVVFQVHRLLHESLKILPNLAGCPQRIVRNFKSQKIHSLLFYNVTFLALL